MSGNIQLEKASMNLKKGAKSAQAGVGEYLRGVANNPKSAAATVGKQATPSWASWMFMVGVVTLLWGRAVLDDEDDEWTTLDALAIAYLTVVFMGVFS